MPVNWGLKSALVERFGSKVEAAKAIGIRENRLSYIVRGHVHPSERERKALEGALGKGLARRSLKRS
ncbi:MAG: helix-turn-helix transcriptional regulator [Deltaproteobacteria bacterium]|nr:helix-turn-helix transcriptional regulator [Deltaproteobacteria bacterium]